MAEQYSFIGIAAIAAVLTLVVVGLMALLHAHLVLDGRFRWYRVPARVGQTCFVVVSIFLATNLKFWATVTGDVRSAESIIWGIGLGLGVALVIGILGSATVD